MKGEQVEPVSMEIPEHMKRLIEYNKYVWERYILEIKKQAEYMRKNMGQDGRIKQ